jgi:hypothetical protein
MGEAPRSKRMDLLEVLTVGLPFCGFKVLAGLSFAGPAGAFLVALGVLDGLINGANLAGLLAKDRRPLAACSLAFAARALRAPSGPPRKWHDLGSSLDVLLSFALVALMIGGGRLGSMPPVRLSAWNACVILNVLGAGLGRIGDSLRDLARGERA